jgi:signal transduction histidine kinase/ActR/RegA family two-component response regulator
MNSGSPGSDSELVLLMAPFENDSTLAVSVLREAGIGAMPFNEVSKLCEQIKISAGVVVIAEEAIFGSDRELLKAALESQPAWSDFPVILLVAPGTADDAAAISANGNISILERPFSRITLIRAVQVGLRARRKQYQIRQLLEEQTQATQKRDEFFASLSHELRTPLNVLLGWIEILRTGDLNARDQKEAFNVLQRNARLQKKLIDDLLDTSRIITGKLHYDPSPVSVVKIVSAAFQALTLQAARKRILMTLNIPAEEFIAMADEQRLTQAITNLLTNALKFTPEDGWIQVSLVNEDAQFKISVKDSGQGIAADFLPQVFDRLKQEDMSITRAHGGLGLGLSITAHIIQTHGGRLEVASEGRNQGAEFTIHLPMLIGATADASLPANSQQAGTADTSLEGLRVLVVDDSKDILELINVWLKKARADVKLVESAAAALAGVNEYRPHVLLSDIGMPEMDGYELISKIRASKDPKVRNLPAVALTAYAKDEERAKALRAGFQMHISKPISKEQLVATVAQLARGDYK